MASKRLAKKDIDFVVEEVVGDCIRYMKHHPDQNHDKVKEIIHKAAVLRNDLYTRINHVPADVKTKAHYREVFKDLLREANLCFESLSKAVSAK
jgi:hypothetical protein